MLPRHRGGVRAVHPSSWSACDAAPETIRRAHAVHLMRGTERVVCLEEDAAAADVRLTDDDLRRLDGAAPVGATAGDRYADMSSVHR